MFQWRLREEADELWRVAYELSEEAGFPYKDREGRWRYPNGDEPPQLSDDIIAAVKEAVRNGVFQPPQTRFVPVQR